HTRFSRDWSSDVCSSDLVHPRPVIAAVDGPAAGGGNEIVIACDFAIATRRSTFGQTGPRIGSAPVLGATNLAAVQIGEKFAKERSEERRVGEESGSRDVA